MPNFILAYRAGTWPETPEEGEKSMADWRAWSDGLGDANVEKGNPASNAKTIDADGKVADGGHGALCGYSIVKADNIDEAVKLAQACPHLKFGTMEVAELKEMEM